MARPDPAYNGRAISGTGVVHLWFLHKATTNESTDFFARLRQAMSEAIND